MIKNKQKIEKEMYKSINRNINQVKDPISINLSPNQNA